MTRPHPPLDLHGRVPLAVDTATRVADNGLRYASKVNGSPFQSRTGSAFKPKKSCLYCGGFKSQEQLRRVKLAGRQHDVCDPPCPSSPKAHQGSPGDAPEQSVS